MLEYEPSALSSRAAAALCIVVDNVLPMMLLRLVDRLLSVLPNVVKIMLLVREAVVNDTLPNVVDNVQCVLPSAFENMLPVLPTGRGDDVKPHVV